MQDSILSHNVKAGVVAMSGGRLQLYRSTCRRNRDGVNILDAQGEGTQAEMERNSILDNESDNLYVDAKAKRAIRLAHNRISTIKYGTTVQPIH